VTRHSAGTSVARITDLAMGSVSAA
jgi:hypothetical protein